MRSKWHIIKLTGITSGQKIPNISYKLPGNVREVKAYMTSANEYAPAAKNYNLGYLSLHFDNKGKHLIYDTVKSKPVNLMRGKLVPLHLDEPVRGCSFVQGFYLDHGFAQSYPYDLRIYLQCIIDTQ
jgi:hypothetical protein